MENQPKSQDFFIRIADEKDAELLCSLGKKSFVESFEHLNNPEDFAVYVNEAFTEWQFLQELQKQGHTFFIACVGDSYAGYAKVRFDQETSELKGENAIELQRIYVLQAYQKIKLGKALMEKCIETAKEQNFETIWLGVWEHNQKAIDFYKRNGFELFSSHVFKLGTDEQTDLLFKKSL